MTRAEGAAQLSAHLDEMTEAQVGVFVAAAYGMFQALGVVNPGWAPGHNAWMWGDWREWPADLTAELETIRKFAEHKNLSPARLRMWLEASWHLSELLESEFLREPGAPS